MKFKTNGILLMILASLLFSFMGAFTKQVSKDMPFMEIVFFRALCSLILLMPYMSLKKVPFMGPNVFWLLVRSVSGFMALSLAFYVTTQIPLAEAALLNHTSILFVALLSVPFLGERVSLRLFIYILLSFCGAMLVIKPGVDFQAQAGFLGILSGFFAGVAYIAIKRLHERESYLTMVFDFSLVSAIGALVFNFCFGWVWPNLNQMFLLLGLGITGTLAQLLMTYSYKYTPATVVSPFQFTGVLFSALWGLLFWAEWPDFYSALGALIIIACGVGLLRINKSSKSQVELLKNAHLLRYK